MNGARPGLGFLTTAFESALQALRDLRRRRLLLFVVGAIACGGFGYVLGGRAPENMDGRRLYSLVAWWLLGTALVPFLAVFLAIDAVHGPIEDRTYQYTFLRPVGRAPLLLGKWLAASLVGTAVAALGATALFLGVAARPGIWSDGVDWSALRTFVHLFAWSAIAYAAVAALFAAWFTRPLLWAAAFVVGLQMLTANLPVSAGLRRLTLTDPLRRLLLDRLEPDARLARALWPAERDYHPDMVGAPQQDLLVFTLVCVALAAWVYSRTEYDSRVRE